MFKPFKFMQWIYLAGIYLFRFFLSIGILFSPKARLWVEGRRSWEKRLRNHGLRAGAKRVWVHCASLGEFEQGRPFIEKLKKEQPKTQVILTFFSPSGFEVKKYYPQADLVCYLPLDTPKNSRIFLDILKPDLAVFVKYEFWYFFLKRLNKQKIPTILISAIFRRKQHFFKFYGLFFRRMLSFFDHLFVQNESSAKLLRKIGITQYTVAGDTRVDRVLNLSKEKKSFPLVQSFVGNAPILIAGSTWPADEAILFPFLLKDLPGTWKGIIAPHEIQEDHIKKIEQQLTGLAIRYSQLGESKSEEAIRFLIIDNVGMLSSLYQYGQIAYIGGGFGRGIHNTLEPITFGLPVIFGPHYKKFEEAVHLTKLKGGFPIDSYKTIKKTFHKLSDTTFYQLASQNAKGYILDNQGATEKINNFIKHQDWV